MGQAVEQRRCHLGVAEDRRPFAEVEGRHDDRGALVKATDEVEQKPGARLGERQISQVVEDQDVETAQEIRRASLSVGAGFGIQLVPQVHDVEEASPLATPDARPADAHGKVGFAGPDLRPKSPPAYWRIRVLISGLMRPAFAT